MLELWLNDVAVARAIGELLLNADLVSCGRCSMSVSSSRKWLWELLGQIARRSEPEPFPWFEVALEEIVHRRDPELFLRAKVVGDELERDIGVVGERAQRRAFVTEFSEGIRGGLE
jgi:hypothetical protein